MPAQRQLSALEQLDLPLDEALRNELRRGRASLASPELREQLALFAAGAGRHGR